MTLYRTEASLRNSLKQARNRCENPSYAHYHRYGGRGIKVCKQWRTATGPDAFVKFVNDTFGKIPKDHQLDRTDNDAGYSPDNIRFVSRKVNLRNRSVSRTIKFKGEIISIYDLWDWLISRGNVPARGVTVVLFYKRIVKRKASVREAFSVPTQRMNDHRQEYDAQTSPVVPFGLFVSRRKQGWSAPDAASILVGNKRKDTRKITKGATITFKGDVWSIAALYRWLDEHYTGAKGLNLPTFSSRVKRGWTVKEAFRTPLIK